MFRVFKDDDQYDAWKALVANAISDATFARLVTLADELDAIAQIFGEAVRINSDVETGIVNADGRVRGHRFTVL